MEAIECSKGQCINGRLGDDKACHRLFSPVGPETEETLANSARRKPLVIRPPHFHAGELPVRIPVAEPGGSVRAFLQRPLLSSNRDNMLGQPTDLRQIAPCSRPLPGCGATVPQFSGIAPRSVSGSLRTLDNFERRAPADQARSSCLT